MMRRNDIPLFWEIIVMLIFLQHHRVASLSRIHQKTALFQFKQSLTIDDTTTCLYFSSSDIYEIPSHPKTLNWSMSSDHCAWDGVGCDQETGDVIGLDLSCSQLVGPILSNSSLFQLSHLRFLNLSNNDFYNEFPQEFGFFAKGLTHLNLSFTGFTGRVPSGISHLYNLVSLDLSRSYYNSDVELEDEVFKSILQNLTQLRVLNLQYVNISSIFPPVNLSTSLRVLDLSYTRLHGVLPQQVFHLPNLELLALGGSFINGEILSGLRAVLPKVKWGSSSTLQHLSLIQIDIYGGIPDSIGFLESLATLELTDCNLSGPIPTSIRNLGQLTDLGLDGNNFNGPIPTHLANLTNLTYLSLSFNNFTGPLPTFKRLITLLDLSGNRLTGLLPLSLFQNPSLEYLYLSSNEFTGQLHEFDSSNSQLKSFHCRNNSLYGAIPRSFSQLVNLTRLDFSSNNFSGVLDISKMFSHLKHLQTLHLSYNSLSVRSAGMTTLPPNLTALGLSSCNMKEFPHISTDAEISMQYVDLSNNEIEGEIPHWIGSVSWYLNISNNKLTGSLEQLPWNHIQYLDLQFNNLNGSLPTSICNSSSLEVLNLSHNNLSGILPICRTELTFLSVFDLRMNNIKGNIPATLSTFRKLETMNLNGNKLEGRIPSSFVEFDSLRILDLGNNRISDTFPQFLEVLPNLQVLVLKSNKFHGLIVKSSKVEHPFPSLRIIDLSSNEFSGPLPATYFENFKAMMNVDVNKIKRKYMGHDTYYSDSTSLVIKGVEIELVRILTVFTTIDVSVNHFEGVIADYIGNLVSLRYLNLSHNHLTGHIPSAFGKLLMLESLDLSFNRLEGKIPQLLSSVCTLARLNLSFNQLRGHIPVGSQFNTFENDSYVGNLGLCGYPLSKQCEHNIQTGKGVEDGIGTEEEEDDDYFFSGFTWEAVVIGYGCGVVPAFFIGYLMLLAGKPKWFAGILARELGIKIRRMEIKWR